MKHTATISRLTPEDERPGLHHLYRPIVFTEPARVVPPASWLDYTPFAFWIVDVLRPSTFVELGCHSGNSYASFAQAVQSVGLATACYGVDTWCGDAQAGFFGEDVFAEWSAYHDRHFSGFSQLIRSTFDDASRHFADGSIDLIHLDGCHTFAAVSHDFDTWQPKLSGGGVVLCHDINVREKDFGAWRFWESVKDRYPSFEFLHGHGLGVLGVGRNIPEPLRWLFSLTEHDAKAADTARRFFARLGAAVLHRHRAAEGHARAAAERASWEGQQRNAHAEVERLRIQIAGLQAQEAAAAAQVARLGTESEQKDAQLAAAAAEVDRLRRDLESAAAHHRQLEDAESRLREKLAEATDGLAARAADVVRLTAALETADAELDRRAQHIHRLAWLGARLRDRTNELAIELDTGRADALRMTRDLARVPAALRDRDAVIDDLDAQIALLLGRLDRQSRQGDADAEYRAAAEVALAQTRSQLAGVDDDGALASQRASWRVHVSRRLRRLAAAIDVGPWQVVQPARDPAASSRGDLAAAALNDRSGSSRIALAPARLAPAANRRTILMVTHVAPWQPKAGNEYRVRRMLQWYRRRGYAVIPVVAPLAGEELSTAAVEGMAAEFGNAVQCHRDGRVEYRLDEAPDVLASLAETLTPSFAAVLGEGTGADRRELLQLERTFCHDVVASTVLHLSRALGPHVLQVEYIWMTRLLPLVRGNVLKVIDTVDVFSSIPEKVGAFGVADVVIAADEEAVRLRRADLAIAIQDEEGAALRRIAPGLPVVTAGVDFDVVAGCAPSTNRQILVVGSNNARNQKGLDDFLRLAWPRIRHRAPDAELVVVGTVGDKIAPRELPGVSVRGPVDDLRELYRNAAVVINPAVAGTGLKIKILEALAHGKPVVAWPSGIDGLSPALAALCRVAHDWYEFAEHVARMVDGRDNPCSGATSRAVAEALAPDRVYASIDAAYTRFFARNGHARG